MLGDHQLLPNFPHDGRNEILIGGIAEEGHYGELMLILVLNRPVVRQARWENDVPGGDKEDFVGNGRPSDVEAACSFSIAPLIGADGEAERDGQGLGDRDKGIGREGRRGTDRLEDAGFAYLYLDIRDAVVVEGFACRKQRCDHSHRRG